MTLLDLFDGVRRDRGAAPAVNGVTYAELHAGSLRVAAELAAHGLRCGDRFAIFCENRLAFVYAYLAALRLGAIVVPTNVLYRAAELEHILANARPSLALVSAQTAAHVAGLNLSIETVSADDVEAWADDLDRPCFAATAAPHDDDLAVILYTSGTTGRSKGAMLSHGNIASIAAQVVVAWRWRANDVLAIGLPLFHMHGLGAALNGTLVAGGHLLVYERFDAQRMLDRMRARDVTMFFGVPAMYVRLLEAIGDGSAPRLRLYVSGSAPLPFELHRTFEERFGIAILERYGASEFGFALSNRYGGPRVAGSVGVPMPGTRVRIVAPGGDAAVTPGEIGELLVSGPTVCAGYWELPEANADAFLVDADGVRWFRSGDLARFDPACDVYQIAGRIKELIISGGFNISPREIEVEIERFPGVLACAVVGVEDSVRGERPAAFVEAAASLNADALLAVLRARLASFKIPKEVHIVDSLPRNALGKIEKHKLKALAAAGSARATA